LGNHGGARNAEGNRPRQVVIGRRLARSGGAKFVNAFGQIARLGFQSARRFTLAIAARAMADRAIDGKKPAPRLNRVRLRRQRRIRENNNEGKSYRACAREITRSFDR
jgi:hypothetical protein